MTRGSEQLFSRGKFYLVCLVVLAFSAGLIYRLYHLQISSNDYWSNYATRQYLTKTKHVGVRGEVLSRDGRILALSVPSVSVAVFPKRLKDEESLLGALEEKFQIHSEQLRQKLKENRHLSYLVLAEGLPWELYKPLRSLNYPGFSVFKEYRRHYPQGKLASQLVGRVSADGKGLSGVELAFNDLLAGSGQTVVSKRDALGKKRISLHAEDYEDLKGTNLVLTIDSVIQEALEEEFALGRLDAEARQVFGIILDPDTGEIIAIGQDKRFDPEANRIRKAEELRDHALQDTFEPGSTLKPLVAAIALEEGAVSTKELLDCEKGLYRVSNHTIRDIHKLGLATLKDVIVHSSNIGMAKIGLNLGASDLYAGLKELGFASRISIGLNGIHDGILRKKLRKLELATVSFGQGISINILQLARAYGAIANGGKLVDPSIVSGGKLNEKAIEVFSPSTVNYIEGALYDVVNSDEGTGKLARVPGVSVYGKTGTAQKADPDGKGYDPMRVQASFAGYVEFDAGPFRKKLVGIVIVDEPMANIRWGGVVAAPIFSRVMSRAVTYLQHSNNARLLAGVNAGSEV